MSNYISGAPATTENISSISPDLLVNSIDSRIVKIRPTATPIDQLSRTAASRRTSSMTVDYYSVDPRPSSYVIPNSIGSQTLDEDEHNAPVAVYTVGDSSIFEPSDTFLTPNIINSKGEPLMFYVLKRENKTKIAVVPLNGDKQEFPDGSQRTVLPSMPVNTTFVRMGRAATELDVQTAQFAAIPRKRSNNCQIFK